MKPRDDADAEVQLVEAAPGAASPEPEEEVEDESILKDNGAEDGSQGDEESDDSNENQPIERSEFTFENM